MTTEKPYSYAIGQAVATIYKKYADKISAVALCNIARRPDLASAYLRHIKIDEPLPLPPESWRPEGCVEESRFWLGFYQA